MTQSDIQKWWPRASKAQVKEIERRSNIGWEIHWQDQSGNIHISKPVAPLRLTITTEGAIQEPTPPKRGKPIAQAEDGL